MSTTDNLKRLNGNNLKDEKITRNPKACPQLYQDTLGPHFPLRILNHAQV